VAEEAGGARFRADFRIGDPRFGPSRVAAVAAIGKEGRRRGSVSSWAMWRGEWNRAGDDTRPDGARMPRRRRQYKICDERFYGY